MSRREFMFTATAAATTLLVLQGCLGGSKKSQPGGRYTVPSDAGRDIGAARHALSGEEFIFDVQGHHLEYDLMRSKPQERFLGSVFPQVNCGKEDAHACFAREVFMEEFFVSMKKKGELSMALMLWASGPFGLWVVASGAHLSR
jgi:hypothetical protein